MKSKYLIPVCGVFLFFKENPDGTDDWYGVGITLYHGISIRILIGVIIILAIKFF